MIFPTDIMTEIVRNKQDSYKILSNNGFEKYLTPELLDKPDGWHDIKEGGVAVAIFKLKDKHIEDFTTVTTKFKNGNFRSEETYFNKLKHGAAKYEPYGTECVWLGGLKKEERLNGGRRACYEYYDKEKTKPKIESYINRISNELDGIYREWNEAGRIRLNGYYLNGKKEGDWIEYFPEGWKKSTTSWKNGIKHGIDDKYDPYNDLIFSDWYVEGVRTRSEKGVHYDMFAKKPPYKERSGRLF